MSQSPPWSWAFLLVTASALLTTIVTARADGGGPSQAHAETEAPGAALRREAAAIFRQRCAACHGERGAGDGAAAAALQPKPRDLTDPAWQDAIADDDLERIVLLGGAATGKSVLMPANPDLTDKPALLGALREHVRSLRRE